MVPDHLDKLARIKAITEEYGKDIDIIIDGNTNVENARKMLAAGATGLVVGTSSMMKHGPEGLAEGYHNYVNALTED